MQVYLRKNNLYVFLKVSKFYGLVNGLVTLAPFLIFSQFSFLHFSVRGISQRRGKVIEKWPLKGSTISWCFPSGHVGQPQPLTADTICFCWTNACTALVWGKTFLLLLGPKRLLIWKTQHLSSLFLLAQPPGQMPGTGEALSVAMWSCIFLGCTRGRKPAVPGEEEESCCYLKIIIIITIVIIAVTEFPKSKNLKEHKVDFINNRIGKNE